MMIVILDKDSKSYEYFINDQRTRRFMESDHEKNTYAKEILEKLRNEFIRLNINPGYHVSAIGMSDASGWDGGLCMHEEDGYWLVYHSERGGRHTPHIFTDVQSAANYFLWFHVCRPDGKNNDVGTIF
jgi:hypothetical protein